MALNDSQINQASVNAAGAPVGIASAGFAVAVASVGIAADAFAVDVAEVGQALAAFSARAVPPALGTTAALFEVRSVLTGAAAAAIEIEALYGRAAARAAFAVSAQVVGQALAGITAKASAPPVAPGEPLPGQAPGTVASWRAEIFAGGVPLAPALTGVISVEGEEGAAKVASFKCLAAQMPGSPANWLNKHVRILYVVNAEQPDGTVVDQLLRETLFTGVIDQATYDPYSATINFSCIDQLKLVVDAAEREEIDAMLDGEGFWHPAVFTADSQGWEYAQERLSTIRGNLELDRFGRPRFVEWDDREGTFGCQRILEDSLDVRMSNVDELLNRVSVQFDYRFTRLLERQIIYSWRAGFSFTDFLARGLQYPLRPMIEDAIDGTGWHVEAFAANPIPRSGSYRVGGATVVWLISEAQRQETIVSMSALLAKRYVRQEIERYALVVTSPNSVSRYGELAEARSYTLETEFDAAPFVERTENPEFVGQLDNADFFVDQLDREDLEQALVTALHLARTDIEARHRESTIAWRVPIEPTLERHYFAALEAGPEGAPYGVECTGKVRAYRHDLDIQTGEATTQVAIALRIGNPGGPVYEALEPPEWPLYAVDDEIETPRVEMTTQIGGNVASGPHDPEAQGFSGNHEPSFPGTIRYPYQFRVETPQIPAETASEPDVVVEDEFTVVLPEDVLDLNIP